MNRYPGSLICILFVILASCTRFTQIETLNRSTPEAEGVSSQNILNFLEAVEKSKHEFHSMMILRHGKVIAEGWWNPYQPELKHTMYSVSKSFTSTAVGLAVAENRMSLSDKVISFFPKDLPDSVSANLAAMTVKDLLTMSAGQEPDPTFEIISRDTNWIKAFLATPVKNKPGTKFLYNSMATYMLSAIIRKVTGENVIDYLTPRFFEPLGIKGIDWETDPAGISTGGWGLRLKTEDMARFGQLYLQNGRWNDVQVLPAEWVEEATSFKIDQNPTLPQAKKDSSDWMQGYCYQFWRSRNNSYRADGAYGQYILVLPEQDAVIAITSETSDMQDILNLIWEYLLPGFHQEALPANADIANKLGDKLASLSLPVLARSKLTTADNVLNGTKFSFAKNDWNTDSVSFEIRNNILELSISRKNTRHKFSFGQGSWKLSETTLPGPSLLAAAKNRASGLLPAKIAGMYQWSDSISLRMKLRYIESPHSQDIVCRFKGDSVLMQVMNSNDFGRRTTELRGSRIKL